MGTPFALAARHPRLRRILCQGFAKNPGSLPTDQFRLRRDDVLGLASPPRRRDAPPHLPSSATGYGVLDTAALSAGGARQSAGLGVFLFFRHAPDPFDFSGDQDLGKVRHDLPDHGVDPRQELLG
jgi:hypothetical protein